MHATRPRVMLLLLSTGLGAGCAEVAPPVAQAPLPGPPAAVAGPSLMVPVLGVAPRDVPDTFFSPRAGGRPHLASDIIAPRGTPVLSADDGTVVRVGQNRLGGNMIYAFDPSGQFVYYYAHLDAFAAGLAPGQPVHRGDVLGYVGSTGNAAQTAPHLHFQLMRRPADGSIHGGDPIDARPLFQQTGQPGQAWARINS